MSDPDFWTLCWRATTACAIEKVAKFCGNEMRPQARYRARRWDHKQFTSIFRMWRSDVTARRVPKSRAGAI